VFLVGGGSRTGHVVSISPSEVKLDDSSVIRKFRVVSIQFAPSP
jgi:hypothetical protein